MNNKQPDSIVLVVDDSTVNLQLVGSILIENNIKPFFSTSGRHALVFLEENIPDLILLDISMPDMDGFEVCQRLKANPRTEHIPVIFFTARTQPDEIVRGFELGGVDYITKPFNKAELIKRITTHVNLKRAMDTIQHQNEELNRLNEAKNKMLSIIAHDLRGPVGNFKEITDIMRVVKDQEGCLDELICLLNESATSTYTLLENLLNWSLSQRNKILVKLRSFQMNECLDPIVDMYASEIKIKNIQVVKDGNHKLAVMADYDMVSVVLRNLMGNAVKYAPGGGTITITMETRGNSVQTSVTNSGRGLSAQEIDMILDPLLFYSSHEGSNGGGSGLGTKLCIEFVRKNGGTLWIDSVEGESTTFHFTLPIP